MAGVDIPMGNVFDNLPDVLIDDILMQCSPPDRIRAAAACQALFKVYDQIRKQLTSQSVVINGSRDGGILLCPQNIGKMDVKLEINGCAGYDDTQVYRKLESIVERIRKDGVLHLSNVHALRIDVSLLPRTAQKCMQLLSQLLPNLISIWFNGPSGMELLSQLDSQSLSGICKLGLTLHSDCKAISGLPALLPNLHTLCLTVHRPLPNKWWQPLSLMSRLRCLSLHLFEEQSNLSALHHLATLRHLKLETTRNVDMRSISGLQHLESLCLRNVYVLYPAAAAQLKVTSLALQSVRLSQPQTQSYHVEAQQQHLAEPYWAKLTRVQLAWAVSGQLLQAMLLPHPAAAGLDVRIRFEMFGNFDSDLTQVYKDMYTGDVRCYCADTEPILGPAYLAAARKTPIVVHAARLHRRLNKPENAKTTDGFPGQNAASHVKHDVGRGIKTRDKPCSHQETIHPNHYDRCFGYGAPIAMCLMLVLVCWLLSR